MPNIISLLLPKTLKICMLTMIPLLVIAGIITNTAAGRHLSKKEVDVLLAKCDAAQEPVFARAREKQIQKCIKEKKWPREDAESCKRYYRDFVPGPWYLKEPLPECTKAWDAEKHLKSNPR